jgi:hypothetical protein
VVTPAAMIMFGVFLAFLVGVSGGRGCSLGHHCAVVATIDALRDGTAEIMPRHRGIPPAQVPEADAEKFRLQMISLMFLAG